MSVNAGPRVFISSTVYDLRDARSAITQFLQSGDGAEYRSEDQV